MDGGAIKPVAPAPPVPVARPQETTGPVEKTELPAEKAVPPVQRSERSRQSSTSVESPAASAPEKLERKNYRDSLTNDVVYRVINPESGEVVHQIPDESLLHIRRFLAAYDNLEQLAKIDRTA